MQQYNQVGFRRKTAKPVEPEPGPAPEPVVEPVADAVVPTLPDASEVTQGEQPLLPVADPISVSEAVAFAEAMHTDALEWYARYEANPTVIPLLDDSVFEEAQREVYKSAHRAWAARYIRTENGTKLTWVGQPWMAQIWDDTCLQITVQKPTQVGATTWAYCTAFHRTVVMGQTGIYTMPTASDVNDFVSGRLDRIIDNSPILSQILGRTGPRGGHGGSKKSSPSDNNRVKHLGLGTLYLRGTQTARQAVSVPCRFLIHDELDLSVPEILEMYQHRLDRVPIDEWQIYYLSTPTIPRFGVNARFLKSCAYQWLVKCTHCNYWQQLGYWEHTKGELTYLECLRCHKALDPSQGWWVAEHPDLVGTRNGYKLTRLMLCTPDQTGAKLLTKLHERRVEARFQRHFVNMDLGEVSGEGAFTITREQLLNACFNDIPYAYPEAEWLHRAEGFTGPYYMGIDQGDTLTITIARVDPARDGNRFRLVLALRRRDVTRGSEAWQYAAKLMDQYRISMCVIDGNPNSASAHDLAKKFPGRVLVCYYRDGQRTQVVAASDVERQASNTMYNALNKPVVDNTTRVDISVERTEALDITASDLVSGGFMFPSSGANPHPEIVEVMRQIENNVRRPVENPKNGELSFRWDRQGPNDYFHSLTYLRLAREEGQRLRSLGNNIIAPVVVHGIAAPESRGPGVSTTRASSKQERQRQRGR